jgi:tetrahydromethanopterin S-methyltransferase subunit F
MSNTFIGILIGFIVLIVLYINFKPETNRNVDIFTRDTTYVSYGVDVSVKPEIKYIQTTIKDTQAVNKWIRLVDSLKSILTSPDGGYGGFSEAYWDTSIVVKKDTIARIEVGAYSNVPFDPDLWFRVKAKINQPIIHTTQLLTPSWWENFTNRWGFYIGGGVGYDTDGKIMPNINISFGIKIN